MFKGISTEEAYEQCLTVGLCERHVKELDQEQGIKEPQEIQRRAFLYIRLRILDPILFGKPFIFEKMKTLVSKSNYFSLGDKSSDEMIGEKRMIESILLLDSIVVFTLCQFCKICCSGCLFQNDQNFETGHNPEADFIQNLLNNKNVTEKDISHLNPILQDNFKGHDKAFIKFCYVIALLFVRNTTIRIRLKQALSELAVDVLNVSKETVKWFEIGEEANTRKNYEEAIKAYTAALKYNPYCPVGLSNRGAVFINIKEFKQAQMDSYISTMIHPPHCQGYKIFAISLLQQNLIEDCHKTLLYGLLKCKQVESREYIDLLAMEEWIRGKLHTSNGVDESLSSFLGTHLTNNVQNDSLLNKCKTFEKSDNIDQRCGKQHASLNGEPDKSETESVKEKEKWSETKVEDVPDLAEAPYSEDDCEDPPSLSEASDSGKSTPDVPDLSDASKSDDADNEDNTNLSKVNDVVKDEKHKKEQVSERRSRSNSSCLSFEKGQNVEQVITVIETVDQNKMNRELTEEEERTKYEDACRFLKEGSQSLLEGVGLLAVRHFREVLDIIKFYPKVSKFEECELVCIKYALGRAYCLSGGFEDLQKSIAVFMEIIEDHSNVTFPSVYYGIGLAFYKLNRFKDSLKYLRIVEDVLEKGIHFKVYAWPGLSTVINETRADQLKDLVENMIKDCESPPKPDAVCRFQDCSTQSVIYYKDPDFKGFLSLHCSEHCALQYHPNCWKTLKSIKQLTDKEFLEKTCLTPDCDGTVTRIESINKEGNLERVFDIMPTKKPNKQKKTKAGKKSDVKEDKRRKRQNNRDFERDKHKGLDESSPTLPPEEVSSVSRETSPDAETENSEIKDCEVEKSENSSISSTSLSINTEPFIVIKKEKIVNENSVKTLSKHKEPKKPKGNTISIDEFCKTTDICSEYQSRLARLQEKNQCTYQKEWPTCNETCGTLNSVESPFIINEAGIPIYNQPSEFEDLFLENDLESVENNLYNYLEDFLVKNGPLSIKDVRLVEELEHFPIEANIVIAKYGGIAEFLRRDTEYRFGIVDDLFLCSRTDLADAYKLSRSSGVIGADNADLLEYEAKLSKEDEFSDNLDSPLNPDAKEYTPPSSSSVSTNSFVSIPEEPSEIKIEKASRNSPSLISAISKLRQPLAVDDDSTNKCTDLVPFQSQDNSSQTIASHSFLETTYSTTEEKISHLTEKCIEAVKTYFNDDMLLQRPYIDSCINPFSIVYIPKKNNKALQTEVLQIEKESKSTMKTDEELDRLKEMIELLTKERRELSIEKTLAESKLTSEMESATKHHKKAAVEIACLKKELEDLNLVVETQKKEHKNKEMKLEREHKLLMESLSKAVEENNQQKKEINIIRSSHESSQESFKKFEESLARLQNENKLLKKSLDQQSEQQIESVQIFDKEKMLLTKRAENSELQLLQFKKEVFFKRIDSKTFEAAQKMKEIELYLSMVNANVLYKKNLEALVTQIRNYVSKLARIRLDFQIRIDEQIHAINNGAVLESLPPVELKDLPEIPSFTPQNPGTNIPANNQLTMWNVEMLNSSFNSIYSGAQGKAPVSINVNPSVFMRAQPATSSEGPKRQPTVSSQLVRSTSSILTNPKLPPGIVNVTTPLGTSTETAGITPKLQAFSNTASRENLSNSTDINSFSKESQKMDIQTSEVKRKLSNDTRTVSPAMSTNLIAISQDPLSSSSSSIDAQRSEKSCDSPSLELGYVVKKNKSEKTDSSTNLASAQSKGKASGKSCTKLLQKLKSKYPEYEEIELMCFVKQLREKRKGGLSGLTIDNIISDVSAIIDSQNRSNYAAEKNGASSTNHGMRNKVLVDKKIASEVKKQPSAPAQKPCPWGRSESDSKNQWSGTPLEEGCIICYEDMSPSNAYKVDCGHCFHLSCIREWLNKKSDCPICRVHLLLPEDYPSLQ